MNVETGEEVAWHAGRRCFVGEPLFVPFPEGGGAEDDGWLLGYVFNAATGLSEVAVLDARSMDLVCTLKLRHHIPYGLHGQFAQGMTDALTVIHL